MKKLIIIVANLLLAGSLFAQGQIGQWQTIDDNAPRDRRTASFRLDSIVGDPNTGCLTLYSAITASGLCEIKLSTDAPCVGDQTLQYWLRDMSDIWRQLYLHEIFTIKGTPSTINKLDVRLFDYKTIHYTNVPIIWRKPECRHANRPAEFYLNRDDLTILKGTEVNPYCGKYNKTPVDLPSATFLQEKDLTNTFDLQLVGLIGNKSNGAVRPILSIRNKSDDRNFFYVTSIEIVDEEGTRKNIESFNGDICYGPHDLWIEFYELSTILSTEVRELQKITINIATNQYDSDRVSFTFRDVPIQWIDNAIK